MLFKWQTCWWWMLDLKKVAIFNTVFFFLSFFKLVVIPCVFVTKIPLLIPFIILVRLLITHFFMHLKANTIIMLVKLLFTFLYGSGSQAHINYRSDCWLHIMSLCFFRGSFIHFAECVTVKDIWLFCSCETVDILLKSVA